MSGRYKYAVSFMFSKFPDMETGDVVPYDIRVIGEESGVEESMDFHADYWEDFANSNISNLEPGLYRVFEIGTLEYIMSHSLEYGWECDGIAFVEETRNIERLGDPTEEEIL